MKGYVMRFRAIISILILASFVLPAFAAESAQPAEGQGNRGARGQRQGAGAEGERRRGRSQEPIVVDPAADARLNQLGAIDIGVHDPSTIVKCKDLYWIFITGRAHRASIPKISKRGTAVLGHSMRLRHGWPRPCRAIGPAWTIGHRT